MAETGHDPACVCERCPSRYVQRLEALNAMHARFTVWTAWLAGAAIVVSVGEILWRLPSA